MEPAIVPAREDHCEFVSWVMFSAARSHLERGMWDLFVDRPEDECLRYINALATTDTRHLFHWSNFLVAEVDGVPAAGMCGYFDEECGVNTVLLGMAEADRALGRNEGDTAAGWQRAGSITHCLQEHAPGAWIVENVATRPEYRRRGLVDKLLSATLDLGRKRGATIADIGVLIGNDPAQRAYEKAGFEVVSEKRHPEFEAAYGCPGVRHLSRAL